MQRGTAIALVIGLVPIVSIVSIVPIDAARACDVSAPLARPPAASNPAGAAAAAGQGEWSQLTSTGPMSYNPECNPWVAAGGTRLFFICADEANGPPRPGYQGSWDIYISTWDDGSGDWGPAVNPGPPVNTAAGERRPTTTADGDTLLFSRGASIMLSIFDGQSWSEPVTLFPGSDPCLTADARQVYYVRNNDIWIADRLATIFNWGNFRPVGAPVNTGDAEVRPFISRDGTLLFFTDFGGVRPGGYGAADIWVSAWNGAGWDPPQNFGPPINTDLNSCTPYLSADGRRFYTSSGAFEGGHGSEDVWVAFLDSLPAGPDVVDDETGAWTRCGELAGARNVYALAEGPDGTLYAATSPPARVFRSIDRGETWEATGDLGGALIAYSILAAGNTLYAGTYPDGDVFVSTDGGDSWSETADLPGATTVRALLRRSDGAVLAGTGAAGAIYMTTDGGGQWTEPGRLPAAASIKALLETATGDLFASGGGVPFRSRNGGATWQAFGTLPFPPTERSSIESIYQTADGDLWCVGFVHSHGGQVFHYNPNTAVWDTTAAVMIGPVHATRAFVMDEDTDGNLRIGYQPGEGFVVGLSSDRGASWVNEDELVGALEVLDLLRATDGTLYAATAPNGDVFRRVGATTGVPPAATAPAGPGLRTVGANPTSGQSRLRLMLGEATAVRLVIVDVAGRHRRTLFAGRLGAGEHEFAWDGRDEHGAAVGSGLYFARLEAAGRVRARKVIVIQ